MATDPDILRFQWAGMNRVLNPFLIKPGDLKLCLNYNSDTFYAKVRRGGYSLFLDNPDASTVYNLIHFDRADGYRFVLRISGTNIFKYAFTGVTWGAATRTNFGGTNDQVQTIGDTNVASANITATTTKLAEGIKVSGAGSKSIPSLWVLLSKTASPGDITLKIETDNAGSASGTPVTNGTFTIPAASVSATTSWIRVDFATAPSLTAGTQYHLTIAAAGVDGSNYYTWYGSAFDVYANGSAKYSTNSGTTYAALTGELDFAFVLNVTGGTRCGSCILNNKIILSNGVNKPCYTTDGVNFTDIVDAPPVKYLIVWQGRVYGLGSILGKSRLYYSKANDPTSWTNDPYDVSTGGYTDVDPDNNGFGTGLDVEANRIIVHKNGGAYKMIPDDFGRPAQVVPIGASTTSHWSIGRSDEFDIGYFFGNDGFFEHTGATPQLLSSGVQDLVESVSADTASDLVGFFFKYKYFCTMGVTITEAENLGGRTFVNPTMVYDLRLKEFYLYTTAHRLNCFDSWKHTDGYQRMFNGDILGNTFVWDGATADYLTPIDGEIETWEDYLGAPHITKRYEYITLYTNPGCEASALYSLDYANPIDLGDLSTGSTKVYFGDNGFNQKNMSLRLKDMSTTTSSVFYGYALRLTGEEVPVQRRGRVK